MIKIDESPSEFEFSSGWKKMIKDKNKDRISEEFRVKIEDMQTKLENLNSSITNLAKKEETIEKTPSENISMEQIIIEKIDKFEMIFAQIEGAIKNIQSELNQYENLIENQNFLLSEITDIIKNRANNDTTAQKGFITNIFKKK